MTAARISPASGQHKVGAVKPAHDAQGSEVQVLYGPPGQSRFLNAERFCASRGAVLGVNGTSCTSRFQEINWRGCNHPPGRR